MSEFVLKIVLTFVIICQLCDGIQEDSCYGNKFPFIVDHVTINGNEYPHLETGANFTEVVRKLNTSYSTIVVPPYLQLTSLIEFISTNNGIESLDQVLNESLPALEFLNVSNNIIREFDGNLLSNAPDLVTLDLSFNCLESISMEIVFQKVYNIKYINLRGNFLKELVFTPPAMYSLTALNYLDLSYNDLSLFQWRSVTVRELLINNNMIERVLFYEPHQDIQVKVEAQFNKIQRYETNVHHKSLNLSHNEIENLMNVDVVHGGKFEHSLDLSYNRINFHEEEVHAKDQQMWEILGPTIFVTDDTHLNLSYNRIDNLKFASEKIRDIGYLNLEGNLLTGKDDSSDLNEIFPRLKYLNLKNNPYPESVVQNLQKVGIKDGQLEINYVPEILHIVTLKNNTRNIDYVVITTTDGPVTRSDSSHLYIILIVTFILALVCIGIILKFNNHLSSKSSMTESIVTMTVQA